ncbi:MAG: hypothetical protein IJS60_06735 [Abditibacteriota bacterium]|nr:hypothetical protein [Abditibacteriota bacterium]
MRKIILLFVVILSVMPLFAEEINYKLFEFEGDSLGFYWWNSNNKISSDVGLDTSTVHQGKGAMKWVWDFTKQDEPASGFANFFCHKETIGTIKAVDFWAYITVENKDTYLNIWTEDTSGEIYMGGIKLNNFNNGWQHINVPISEGPAWESGDKNRKKDMPMSLFGIAVEGNSSPLVGEMYIDDISVTVEATPRESILNTLHIKDDIYNKSWGILPEMEVYANNLSQTDVPGLLYHFKVYDGFDKLTDEKTLDMGQVAAGQTEKKSVTFNVPYGQYRVDWTLSDGEGPIMSKSQSFTHLSERAGVGLSPALEKYLTKTGYWGGVFWQCTPEQGRDAGARWIRGFGGNWENIEIEKGKYDVKTLRDYTQSYLDKGIETLLLMTLYEPKPSFRDIMNLDFATSYGALFDNISKGCKDILHWYELGNEDNGANKLLYTEVARNGAAGIRKNDSTALIGNSGTAFVDVSWFELQKKRDLFKYFDLIITHPYTVTSSPEEWGVYDQGQNMINFIDSIGGFKELWSTEFGYSIGGDGYIIPDTTRAKYLVRHFLIQIAAGYLKPGLYSWDGHFGIYANEQGTSSLVAVHNMTKLLEGYRYAGFLTKEGYTWAVVYEKLGADPIVIAWNLNGQVNYPIKHSKVLDLYGNPVNTDGDSVVLSDSPIYIYGADNNILKEAYKDSVLKELARYEKLTGFNFGDDTGAEEMFLLLNRYSDDSAAQFHLLKALMVSARYEDIPKDADKESVAKAFITKAKKALEDARLNDTDNPRLRWALHQFENLEYERLFAIEEKSPFEKNIRNAQKILAFWATDNFITSDTKTNKKLFEEQKQVWTYLYTKDKDGKSFSEKLSFVPGKATGVEARVNNYANKATVANVSLKLPEGWTCEPQVQKVSLKPGKSETTYFEITAASSTSKDFEIITKTDIGGKPSRVGYAVMNEITLLAPVILTQIPMTGLITDTPMSFNLKNVDSKTHSGEVIICLTSDKSILGSFGFENLGPDETVNCQMSVNENISNIQNYDMYAEIRLDNGMTGRVDFSCDFSVATKAISPINIDGDLSDWADALPLHLNKIDYTNNSFGGAWSPEDLSGTVYYKWDEDNLYMAAKVKDQTFNQGLTGASTWMQDSLQFALVPTETPKKFYEYCMAYTPEGPQIYMDMASDPSREGLKEDIPLSIKLSQGEAVYELAIPWAKYEAEFGKPFPGKEMFYDILLNDDDAVTPRRYMERFTINIVHDKGTHNLGVLKLIDQAESLKLSDEKVILRENFDSMREGDPDLWKVIHKGAPILKVAEGYGINNSNALYLYSDSEIPDTYSLMTKTVDVEPGAEYELSMKIKGSVKGDAVFGVCSDQWGNQDMSYIDAKGEYPDWTEIKFRFTSGISTKNIIIRNGVVLDVLVDDIKVSKVR